MNIIFIAGFPEKNYKLEKINSSFKSQRKSLHMRSKLSIQIIQSY